MGQDEQAVILSSDAGYGFVSTLGNLNSKTKSGKHVIILSKQARANRLAMVEDIDNHYVAPTLVGGAQSKSLQMNLPARPFGFERAAGHKVPIESVCKTALAQCHR